MSAAATVLVKYALEKIVEGRRIRVLRKRAHLNQIEVGRALGYTTDSSASGNMSKAENSKGLPDAQKRVLANFLSGKGDLVTDARILYDYMVGEHDSLDRCLRADSGSSLVGRRGIEPRTYWTLVAA